MTKTLEVEFDGEVFRPESPVNLEANTRYLITVEALPPASTGTRLIDVLERLTGSVEAPEDWASEHDHYLYGTPKRGATE